MYHPDMSSLSATARVILGLLGFEPRTGYDVKRVTDYSTRFFWRASYGRIYPELGRLEAAGLVEVRDEPHGRRRRRVHALTAAGERELRAWLADVDELYEIRDEGLLRLFFGELMEPEALVELARRRRASFEAAGLHFRGIADDLPDLEGPSADVLRYGIELMDWNAAWWADLEARLLSPGA
jgi:DNA-binding PadR family transcriptional regulator